MKSSLFTWNTTIRNWVGRERTGHRKAWKRIRHIWYCGNSMVILDVPALTLCDHWEGKWNEKWVLAMNMRQKLQTFGWKNERRRKTTRNAWAFQFNVNGVLLLWILKMLPVVRFIETSFVRIAIQTKLYRTRIAAFHCISGQKLAAKLHSNCHIENENYIFILFERKRKRKKCKPNVKNPQLWQIVVCWVWLYLQCTYRNGYR